MFEPHIDVNIRINFDIVIYEPLCDPMNTARISFDLVFGYVSYDIMAVVLILPLYLRLLGLARFLFHVETHPTSSTRSILLHFLDESSKLDRNRSAPS